MRRIYPVIKFLVGWPLSVIALFFVGKIFYTSSISFTDVIHRINPGLLILGIVFYLFYFFTRSFLWQQILVFENKKIPLKKVSFAWEIAELRRYIPGNLWSFISRATIFKKKGVETKIITKGLLTEAVLLVLGSAIISVFSTPIFIKVLHLPNNFNLIIWLYILLLISALYVFVLSQKALKKNKLFYFLPKYYPKQSLTLIAVSCTSFIFYSIGTFLTIISVIYLPPKDTFQLLSLFSASFLLGYLSLITPSGLGVREGALVLGLARYLTLPLASLSALFSRVVLIISEIIFLILSFVWEKSKAKWLEKITDFISNHKQLCILLFLILCYCAYFITATIMRYNNYYTGRFDLGNMDQTVWNTLHGRIFQLTNPDSTNITTRLGTHADFILILLAPLYFVWTDPRMLLIIQTIILSLGALFVYLIGNSVIKNKKASLLLAFAYLLNPAMQFTNLFDFHPVTLTTTFLLATFYFLNKKRYLLFSLFLFLSVLTKEELWFTATLFGLYLVSIEKKRVWGSVLVLTGLLMFYLLIAVIIPYARGGQHFALAYFSAFGSTPAQVIKNIISHPLKVFQIIFAKPEREFLGQILLPLGFIPLFAPFLLAFALPDLIINLLSDDSSMHQIYFQYTAGITPFLFVAAIYSIYFLSRKMHFITPLMFSTFILITSLYSAYLFGPLPGAKDANLYMFTNQLTYTNIIDSYIQKIPPKYSIAASNNIGSHLSHRQRIYTIPVGINKADIIVFLLNDKTAYPSLDAHIQLVQQLKQNRNYILEFEYKDFVVFEKASIYPSDKIKNRKTHSLVHFIQQILPKK